jgi:hypothetical protein
VFECDLLQSTQRGAVTVEHALEQIADARDQIQHVRVLLTRLGNRDENLPIRERCAETLAADSDAAPQDAEARRELETSMTRLENTIWNAFLGSGKRRPK